jgi:hypothetical protein
MLLPKAGPKEKSGIGTGGGGGGGGLEDDPKADPKTPRATAA